MAVPLPPFAHVRHRGRVAGPPARALSLLAAVVLAVVSLGVSAPASPVSAACGSFQARVDAASSGSTITIPSGCVYKEDVEIRKALTINAAGAVIDGENTRAYGLSVFASDVTVNGLTVKRIRSDTHKGAVWTTNGASRFTFRDGRAVDSATICISLNGGSGHRILRSRMSGCGKEGYFLNGVSGALFEGNDIHSNNLAGAFDDQGENGGGKAMASQDLTFKNNRVHDNRGPGIWFDNGVKRVTVTGNRVYNNADDGIFFEISDAATISGNVVWNNGFANPRWAFGAGILISSSDRAVISGNVVANNARGISVISQARPTAPHTGNVIRNNTVIQKGTAFVTGFYDDHGGSLFSSANGNGGSGNKYWVGGSEPSTDRFGWNGPRSRLSSYNGTPGEEGGRYLSTSEKNAVLAAAGISGATVVAPVPNLWFRPGGELTTSGSTPAKIVWKALSGATGYQAQLRRAGTTTWTNVALPSARATEANVVLRTDTRYEIRLRARVASGTWTAWKGGPAVTLARFGDTAKSFAWSGGWVVRSRSGAFGGTVHSTWTNGATVTIKFDGRAVAVIAPRGTTSGKAVFTIDGRSVTVDLHRSEYQTRRIVFHAALLSPTTTHTLTIRGLGTAGHARVDIDAVAVLR
jgi:parallel beta-helix repeat protein